jgi:uncharacterized protein (DUF4415 family)
MADSKISLDPNDHPDVEIDDADNPEWTQEDFAKARPLREVLPELYAALVAEREVTLTLPGEVVEAFEAQGGDWRARMSQALSDVAKRFRAA